MGRLKDELTYYECPVEAKEALDKLTTNGKVIYSHSGWGKKITDYYLIQNADYADHQGNRHSGEVYDKRGIECKFNSKTREWEERV